MNLTVTPVTLKNIKEVKKIYTYSFAKEDRMSPLLMLMLSKTKNTDFLSFYNKAILCGFVYMASINGLTFIMFFAVDKKLRSKGFGSQILDIVQSMYPDNKLIVSIDTCDKNAAYIEQRLRRKNFYNSNGYADTKYLLDMSDKAQEILIKNGEFDKDEFCSFFKKYSNGSINPKIWQSV